MKNLWITGFGFLNLILIKYKQMFQNELYYSVSPLHHTILMHSCLKTLDENNAEDAII